MNSAPVLFIIFNRPDTTRQVFSAIREARPARLYVAADGPRENREGERQKCEETRAILKLVDWECEVKTLFRESNLGCKRAVSSAIDWFFENEEEGIILEDDCLPDPSFFDYCEDLLCHYRDEKKIFMISGNNFYSESVNSKWLSYGFVHIPHIWGWATWRRAWKNYDIKMAGWEDYINSDVSKKYWIKNVYKKYWSEMFIKTINGEIDTWDYSWAYSIFVNDALCVAPNKNLVSNIGFGLGDRTLDKRDKMSGITASTIIFPLIHPREIACDKDADYFDMDNHFTNYYFLKKFLKKIKLYKLAKELYFINRR